MAIYCKGHGAVVLVRFATLEDVTDLELRRPTDNDRANVKHRELVIVRCADGSEVIARHGSHLIADGGPAEFNAEIAKLPIPGATVDREELIRTAIMNLKQARLFLAMAGAPRAAAAVRRAIKSAGGAERHAGRLAREAARS